MADANHPAAPGTPTDITQPNSTTPATATADAGAITTAAPAAEETRITLPPRPPRQPAAPEVFQRRLAILDHFVLLPLLLAFAAFIAARPVRNSDVLMHLATGRDLVEGKYNPFTGQDPFGHTTTGVRWVNHSWLYDVLSYEVYRVGGIVALNAVKCLLIVILAFVMVRVGRGGRGLVGPVLCAALALLAMRSRLLLQPVVVSMLFLGLTLWLLQRGGGWLYARQAEEEPAGRKPVPSPVTWKNYWPLLLLFALWVNLDEWFFLGPLTVGLYALGQFIQAKLTERRVTAATPRPGEVRALGLIFVLGLVACLLNPQHVHAFQLPLQLLWGVDPVADVLARDSFLQLLFYSPFNPRFFRAENIGAAAVAYFPLALLGLASFLPEYRGLRWSRVLPFGFFLALSLWHQRAVPFFAVVAAPVMALNFQDTLRRLRAAPADFRLVLARQRGLVTGRVLGALLLLLGLGAAWPGYLEARPFADYRVALVDELDPSLRQAALWFKEQRDRGVLPPDALVFNASPETANGFAWYCPEEKGFFDFRFALFRGAADDYVRVRQGLEAPLTRAGEQGDWEAILKKHKVDHLVLYYRNAERSPLRVTLLRLWQAKDWVELYNDGRTVVFGWARERPAYRGHRLDPLAQAYAPAEDQRAPAEGMPRLPAARPFWLDFTRPLPPRTLGADEALLHLTRFDAARPAQARRNRRDWGLALASGVLGGATPTGGLAPGRWLWPLYLSQSFDELRRSESQGEAATRRLPKEQAMRFGLVNFLYQGQGGQMFLSGRDSAPPVHLLLAARAARRGLAENPEDFQALARLGESYYRRLAFTREREQCQAIMWTDPQNRAATIDPRPLALLRHIQAVTALEQSLLLRQDQFLAHAQLATLYAGQGVTGADGRRQQGFMDLELQHLKAAQKYLRPENETAAQFEQRRRSLQERIDALEAQVERELNGLENSRPRFPKVLTFAQRAWAVGLGGKALQILLDSNLAAFGAEGAQFQIMLALMTGRVRDVSKWFEDDRGTDRGLDRILGQLGPVSYPWWRAMLAAATGDYAEADKQLQVIAARCHRPPLLTQMLRQQMEIGIVFRKGARLLSVQEAACLLIGKAVLDAPLGRAWVTHTPTGKDERVGYLLELVYFRCSRVLVDEAQAHVLRGLLALEQGDAKRAAEAFGTVSARLRTLPPRLPVRVIAEDHLRHLK